MLPVNVAYGWVHHSSMVALPALPLTDSTDRLLISQDWHVTGNCIIPTIETLSNTYTSGSTWLRKTPHLLLGLRRYVLAFINLYMFPRRRGALSRQASSSPLLKDAEGVPRRDDMPGSCASLTVLRLALFSGYLRGVTCHSAFWVTLRNCICSKSKCFRSSATLCPFNLAASSLPGPSRENIICSLLLPNWTWGRLTSTLLAL